MIPKEALIKSSPAVNAGRDDPISLNIKAYAMKKEKKTMRATHNMMAALMLMRVAMLFVTAFIIVNY